MKRKSHVLIVVAVLILVGIAAGCFILSRHSDAPAYTTAKAQRHDIRVVVNTNGIVEPADRSDIYAPLDAFIISITKREGTNAAQGQVLFKLNSEQLRSALAEANAGLLAARRQARTVETGPSKEELNEVDASIAETSIQLEQLNKDITTEEALLAKQATTRMAVENFRKQRPLLQLRIDSLKQKKQDLQARYSAEDKALEQQRITELTTQVNLLHSQLLAESVVAPKSGIIYSLHVKQGAFVTKGQLLAQMYKPGKVMLRTYVDEPDLGRISKGQSVRIEWDGMPNQYWTGVVEKPAEQVVAMNNRSVGEVLCSIDSGPAGLIPNLNVRVEVTTEQKQNALVVPRNAVFNSGGKTSVLVPQGEGTVAKPVTLGLLTTEEIEILSGISDGETVILNPGDMNLK
jgi:RND family efflux transporter MFP subunit